MMIRWYVLGVIIPVIFLNACTIKKAEIEQQDNSALSYLPSWVLDPAIERKIAAVGMAPRSRGGLQFQIPQAEADARANIASQINTEVSRLTKNALREARIADQDDIENIFTQVTKNVVRKIPLMGARRINMYKDPKSDELYVHMAIDSEMVAEHFSKNRQLFSDSVVSSSLARDRIDKAQKAVNGLFKELNKELND